MQYIIFGAGNTGKVALNFLGYMRVYCFSDNFSKGYVCDKRIITYSEMLGYVKTGNYIIVVASSRYCIDMVEQLKNDNVSKYFIFRDADVSEIYSTYPGYFLYRRHICIPYEKVLSDMCVQKYKKIAVYGDDFFLPYFLSEICFQSSYENIVGVICDSTVVHTNSLGIPQVSLNDVWEEIDCLIIYKRRNESDIFEKFHRRKHKFDILNIYDAEFYEPSFTHRELTKYKGIHNGQRCFIVGNGPSVRMEDLNTLHCNHEICFGFNKVYRAYKYTNWRPNYLCMGSWHLSEQNGLQDISRLQDELILTDITMDVRFPNANYVHIVMEDFLPNSPRFSSDITRGVFWGGTVVYDIGLQFAAYMGIKEIYLLGVEASYGNDYGKVPGGSAAYFIEDYINNEERSNMNRCSPPIDAMLKGLSAAEEYSREHGFRIYNATRGGRLNMFERVDFDSLF